MKEYEIHDIEEQERFESLKASGADNSNTWDIIWGAILLFLFLPLFVFIGLLLEVMLMSIICAWWQKILKVGTGDISHGICQD